MQKKITHAADCSCADCREKRDIEAFELIRGIHKQGAQTATADQLQAAKGKPQFSGNDKAVFDAVLPVKAELYALKVRTQETKRALSAGRSLGAKGTKESSEKKLLPIHNAVDALFERPNDPINRNGLLVTEATTDQIVKKVHGITGLRGYTETTFSKIVGARVAHCRKLRREQQS